MTTYNVKVTLKSDETYNRIMDGENYKDILLQVKALCYDPTELKFVEADEILEHPTIRKEPRVAMESYRQVTKYRKKDGQPYKAWVFVGWSAPYLRSEHIDSYEVKGKWLVVTGAGNEKSRYNLEDVTLF